MTPMPRPRPPDPSAEAPPTPPPPDPSPAWPVVLVAGSTRSPIDGLLAEFSARWRQGDLPEAEGYLDRLAALGGSPSDAVELIYREFCLAESAGLDPDPESYGLRFPAHADRLGRLLGLHRALDSSRLRLWAEPDAIELPGVGDAVGPYLFERELGRGTFARVFLARQADLADRHVVVKVAARPSVEPQLLARARHPHIVEVLRCSATDDGSLHLVCMPFLGGASLAAVLETAWSGRGRPRSGRALLEALGRVEPPESPDPGASCPARDLIERSSYAGAVVWIVARLAEALDHARNRGVTHGDLKPSNVLIASDGRPLLLDFNLAVDGRADAEGPGGGTPAYMAPERLAALADPSTATRPTADARHRADLYALGLLLREALTGRRPEVATPAELPRDRVAAHLAATRSRPDAAALLSRGPIPPGLRPILAKLLAPEPADRYRRASDLAEDLDRWRTDRPTIHADEPAPAARLARWARRRRSALLASLLVLAVGLSVSFVASAALHRNKAQRALDRIDTVWGGGEPGVYRFYLYWDRRTPADTAASARFLSLYGLDRSGQGHWRLRDDVRTLPSDRRDELELWLMEHAWRYANDLAERPAPGDWRRAILVLDAEPRWAALEPIARLRQQLDDRLNDDGVPPPPARPMSRAEPWLAAYLDGLAAESEDSDVSLTSFLQAESARPGLFWVSHRIAAASYRRGEYQEAVNRLEQCLARYPRNAELLLQSASCLYQLGQYDRALAACDRALEVDPEKGLAYRTRAFIHNALGQKRSVAEDAQRFSLLGTSDGFGRFLQRLLPGAPGGLEPAIVSALEVHQDPEIRLAFASQLFESNQYEESLRLLDSILRDDPEHITARYHRGLTLNALRQKGGNVDFERVIKSPRFVEFYGVFPGAIHAYSTAVDGLLRQKKPDDATAKAREGLSLAEARGDLIGRAQMHYAVARSLASSPLADLSEVAAHLRESRELDPQGWQVLYARDTRFDWCRVDLREQLKDSTPIASRP